MKKLIFLPLLLLATVVVFNACRTATGSEQAQAIATIGIEGMACEMGCARFIEDKVGEIPGVVSIDVDFEGKVANVRFQESELSGEKLANAIEGFHDGQYQVTTMDVLKVEQDNGSTDSANDKKREDKVQAENSRFSIQLPNIFAIFNRLMH